MVYKPVKFCYFRLAVGYESFIMDLGYLRLSLNRSSVPSSHQDKRATKSLFVDMDTLSRREEEALLKTTKARAQKECDPIIKGYSQFLHYIHMCVVMQ